MDVLRNESYKTYDKLSRYQVFPYYYHTLDDKYIQGVTAHLDTTTPYIAHKVEVGDTFDNLALYYYNNPTYYWIICDFNRIQDAFSTPVVGTYLKIPTFAGIVYDI